MCSDSTKKYLIKASVVMITYNQENFISQAIDSILMQQTNFKFELLIGDDCSTDNTRNIIRDYQKKYSDTIQLLINKANIGVIKNFCQTLQACHGQYIALCEGDDYWTHPNKLQKQVDFLEKNEEYTACAHQSIVIYENSSKDDHLFNQYNESRDFTINEINGLRKFHTASLVFRTEILSMGGIPLNITSGDRAIFFLCASFGPVKYFSSPMCVYRKNTDGISSRVTADQMKKDLNIIPWIKNINPLFPKRRVLAYIHKTIIDYPSRVSIIPLTKHYLLHVWYSFSYFPENLHEMRGSLKIFIQKLRKSLRNG